MTIIVNGTKAYIHPSVVDTTGGKTYGGRNGYQSETDRQRAGRRDARMRV